MFTVLEKKTKDNEPAAGLCLRRLPWVETEEDKAWSHLQSVRGDAPGREAGRQGGWLRRTSKNREALSPTT